MNKNLKRILALVLCLALAVCAFSCAKPAGKPDASEAPAVPTEEPIVANYVEITADNAPAIFAALATAFNSNGIIGDYKETVDGEITTIEGNAGLTGLIDLDASVVINDVVFKFSTLTDIAFAVSEKLSSADGAENEADVKAIINSVISAKVSTLALTGTSTPETEADQDAKIDALQKVFMDDYDDYYYKDEYYDDLEDVTAILSILKLARQNGQIDNDLNVVLADGKAFVKEDLHAGDATILALTAKADLVDLLENAMSYDALASGFVSEIIEIVNNKNIVLTAEMLEDAFDAITRGGFKLYVDAQNLMVKVEATEAASEILSNEIYGNGEGAPKLNISSLAIEAGLTADGKIKYAKLTGDASIMGDVIRNKETVAKVSFKLAGSIELKSANPVVEVPADAENYMDYTALKGIFFGSYN